MGIDVIITQKIIAKLLSASNSGRFVVGTKYNSPKVDEIKQYLFEECANFCSSDFGKVGNMKDGFRLMFKILINCIIPREGSIDQISWDQKHFIFYLKNEDKINISAYIFNHLCEAIKDNIKLRKKNVAYARLLSELLFQGHLIDSLKSSPNNENLDEIYGNILSTYVLANMKMKKKCEIVSSKMPISIRRTNSIYLEDYPVITKMDNLELIKNIIIQIFKDIPNKSISNKRKHEALDV